MKARATFNPIIRWGSAVLSAAAITAITQGTPVQITAPGHGIPNGWPVAVVGVNGLNGINATRYPPVTNDLHDADVTNANTVVLNDISSALMVPAYVSGGSLVWNTPQSLVDVVATLTIWDDVAHDDTPLAVLTNALGGSGLTVDSVNMMIIPFLQTQGLAWAVAGTVAYYELDVTDAAGVIHNLFTGKFTVQ